VHVNAPGALGPVLNLSNRADLLANPDQVDGTAAAIDLNISLQGVALPLPPQFEGTVHQPGSWLSREKRGQVLKMLQMISLY
jgi:hypothetical protein